MSYMRIHCDYCGGSWEVYRRDNWKDDKARECPHCFTKIDPGVWERNILPAFAYTEEANMELLKDHTGHHRALFSVDFISNHIFKNKEKE